MTAATKTLDLGYSVEKALSNFRLIDGVGNGQDTACAMSLLCMVDNPEASWSDHPECANPRVADLVIHANDAAGSTPESRKELVRAGITGVLDTWWIPELVIVQIMQERFNIHPGFLNTPHNQALAVLHGITAWKENKERPDFRGKTIKGENLNGTSFAGLDLTGTVFERCDLTNVSFAGAFTKNHREESAVKFKDCQFGKVDFGYINAAFGHNSNFNQHYGDLLQLPEGWTSEKGTYVNRVFSAPITVPTTVSSLSKAAY